MSASEVAALAVQPWLAAVSDFDRWIDLLTTERSESKIDISRLRQSSHLLRGIFQVMASGAEAIPAATPGEQAIDRQDKTGLIDAYFWGSGNPEQSNGWPGKRKTRPNACEQLRSKRQAVLNFAVWRLLHGTNANRPGDEIGILQRLMEKIVWSSAALPAALTPTLLYAASDAAMDRFNNHLPATLSRLAAKYPALRSRFEAMQATEPFDGSFEGLKRWAPIWAVAAVVVYIDSLIVGSTKHKTWPSIRIWSPFKAGEGMSVLSTSSPSIKVDLHANVVVAQALAHDPARWRVAHAQDRSHRLQLDLHHLGAQDVGSQSKDGTRTVIRGLGIEMVYQAAFVELAGAALANPAETASMKPNAVEPAGAHPIVIDLVDLGAGHEAMLNILLRWNRQPMRYAVSAGMAALSRAAAANPLDAAQRRALTSWHDRRQLEDSAAQRMDPSLLGWTSEPLQRFQDESGTLLTALGYVHLADALRSPADWLDMAFVARIRGVWRRVPIMTHDDFIDGKVRTWLLLCPGCELPGGLDVEHLRRALSSESCGIWAVHRAGLGALVVAALFVDEAA